MPKKDEEARDSWASHEAEPETSAGEAPGAEAEQAVEAEARPPIPPPPTYIRRRRVVELHEEIRKLEDKPITIREITDRKLVLKLLAYEDEGSLEREAEYIFQKWVRRRGMDAPPDTLEKVRSYWSMRVRQTVLCRHLMAAYGILGPQFLTYSTFMLQLIKKVKNEPLHKWPQIADMMIRVWSPRPYVDPRILRPAAHLALKLASLFAFG